MLHKIVLTVGLLALASLAAADVPRVINYQGRLTDPATGDPVSDGDYILTFMIYDAPSGGTNIWSSANQMVSVTDGLFTYLLGSAAPLPNDLFTDTLRWLGIKVGADPELTPRTKLTSVPYAYHTRRADTADVAIAGVGGGGGWTDDGTVVRLTTSSDSIGIGTTEPIGRFDVLNRFTINDNGQVWQYLDSPTWDAFHTEVTGGAHRFCLNADGTMEWGGYSLDADLFREEAHKLRTHDTLIVDGKVGIGTVTPAEKLAVSGAVDLQCDGVGGGEHAMKVAGAEALWYNGTYFSWGFGGDANYFADRVGIGNFPSDHMLHVEGNFLVTDKATIGPNNTNTGINAFVAGKGGTAGGDYSTIGGGQGNTASGASSTIGGGYYNTASHGFTTVAGGYSNNASGNMSFVGGGSSNNATQVNAVVVGGYGNTADGEYTTVGGGTTNHASAVSSTIAGGVSNTASGGTSTVGGGYNNTAGGNYSTVGGGGSNTASGLQCTVSGGQSNLASGESSTVSGGSCDTAIGAYSTVGGGSFNTAKWASTIIGGIHNAADGSYSFIGGGWYNHNRGQSSSITGGVSDTLTEDADYSMVFGSNVYVDNAYRVVFFDSTSCGRLGLNRDDHDGGISHPIHVGTGATNGNGAHLTAGGVWTNGSSRSFKEDFQLLDGSDVLDRIDRLPMEAWEYKGTNERHIWPCAEDFHGQFDVGVIKEDGTRDTEYLAAGDIAGVALAGVKELAKENRELRDRIEHLESLMEALLAGEAGSPGDSQKLAVSSNEQGADKHEE